MPDKPPYIVYTKPLSNKGEYEVYSVSTDELLGKIKGDNKKKYWEAFDKDGKYKYCSERKKQCMDYFRELDKERIMAQGGGIGFEKLSKQIAKNYEGKKVAPKYQHEYGKTYSKSEAQEVGDKVAGKVYWQQQGRKMATGGGTGARQLVVLDEGNGKIINNLFNDWTKIKSESEQEKWNEKVRLAKFGTYGTTSIFEVLDKFDFDKASLNEVVKRDFKKEINNALKYARGGNIKKYDYSPSVEEQKSWSEEKSKVYDAYANSYNTYQDLLEDRKRAIKRNDKDEVKSIDWRLKNKLATIKWAYSELTGTSLEEEFAEGGNMDDIDTKMSTAIYKAYGDIDDAIEFKFYDPERGIPPYRLVYLAIKKGFITPEEITKDLLNSAYETSSETADAEEIGSSDMNYYVWSMLRDAGFDMKVENGYYVRVGNKMATGGNTSSADQYIRKSREKQAREEEGKYFAPYRAFVYSGSDQFADFKGDDFHKAVTWAKQTLEKQKAYRKNSESLWAIVDEFTPIEERGNVIYPYKEVARFTEENIKNMKFATGGSMSSGIKTYYITLNDGSQKEYTVANITEIPNIYFSFGRDGLEKGTPMVYYDNALNPLFNEDGTFVNPIPEYAGKDYWEFKNKMATGGNTTFYFDQAKKTLGETLYNHIASLNKEQLEKHLSRLQKEIERMKTQETEYTKQQFLPRLKQEEKFILYRLERLDEFKYAQGGNTNLETIELKYYNIHNQVVQSGKVTIDYSNETITLGTGKTYKVEPDRHYTYKFLKNKIKASGGINGLAEYLKEINDPSHPSNTRVIDFLEEGEKKADGGNVEEPQEYYRVFRNNAGKDVAVKILKNPIFGKYDYYVDGTLRGQFDTFAQARQEVNYENFDMYKRGGGLGRYQVSGTKSGYVDYLPNKKYQIKKDVANAETRDYNTNSVYTGVVLPKGSIVNNLAGGVFVVNEKLKVKYPTIYNEKYGLPIIRKSETLNEILNNSEILEYERGGGLPSKELPTFDNTPSWAKWVAQHKDGEWWFYDSAPRLVEGVGWKNSDRDGYQWGSDIKTDSRGWDKKAYLVDKKSGKIMAKGGGIEDSRAKNYIKDVIKYSDSYKNGEGFSSRFIGATNKAGDRTNGEYVVEDNNIFWTYTDKQGRDYSSSEQPAIRLHFAEGGMIKVGSKVKTKHGTIGEVTRIYPNEKYPFVVTIMKNGMPYGSDYKKDELELLNNEDKYAKGGGVEENDFIIMYFDDESETGKTYEIGGKKFDNESDAKSYARSKGYSTGIHEFHYGTAYAKGGNITEKDFVKNKEFTQNNVLIKLDKLSNPNYYRANYIDLNDNEKISSYGSPNWEDVVNDINNTKYAKGGLVVTSIKDIPNFKEELEADRITYRGLGMGKIADDFFEIAGEGGFRIKVKGKEYYITRTEFNTFSRDSSGKMRIKFDAPFRKFETGGSVGGYRLEDFNPLLDKYDQVVSYQKVGNLKLNQVVGKSHVQQKFLFFTEKDRDYWYDVLNEEQKKYFTVKNKKKYLDFILENNDPYIDQDEVTNKSEMLEYFADEIYNDLRFQTSREDFLKNLGLKQKMAHGGEVFNSEFYKDGGSIKKEKYAYVQAETTSGKKVFRFFEEVPTHKEVYAYFRTVKDEHGNPITLKDATIHVEEITDFDRELFLEKANEVAISTFGSPIKELDDMMFSFDKHNLSVFKFEAELENGMEVSIQTVDGVIVIEAEEEDEDKFKDGGSIDINFKKDTDYIKRENIKLVKYKNGKELYNWDYWDSYNVPAEKDELFSGIYVAHRPLPEKDADKQYSMFKAGGKLPETAFYIKRSDIDSVVVYDENKGEEIEIPANRIVNGIWFDNQRTQLIIDRAKKEGLIPDKTKKTTTFIARFNGKKIELEAKSTFDAEQKAIKELKVPKSKRGLLSVMSKQAYERGDFQFN